MGKNTIKVTTATKVGVPTKDGILHVLYMYWFFKYQNYILSVISRIGFLYKFGTWMIKFNIGLRMNEIKK
jgi:hypothetical protein